MMTRRALIALIAGSGLAAMPDSPFGKAVIMSVPPAGSFRPLGRGARFRRYGAL